MSHLGQDYSRWSMISGERVMVTGGVFNQHVEPGNRRKSSFDIMKESVAHTAFHNSSARFDPPKCHPNTRVAVLQKIMDWIHRTDWQTLYKYILWLTGAAGAGKSSIAQSIIELCLTEGLVIASFFFSRTDISRNHGGPFVATLAYQIFFSIPATQRAIEAVIDQDPLIFNRSLDHQFDTLIIQPLRAFYNSVDTSDPASRRLIVIDGLDECVDRGTQQQILKMLCHAIRRFELPVIFLLASRPEHEINSVFNSKAMDGVFVRLFLDHTYSPDDDICTFLQDKFDEIKENHPFRRQIPQAWPTPEVLVRLIQKSSGQFIYAATVIRYVQSLRHRPDHRLEVIMNLRPAQGELPFAELDALYMFILSSTQHIEKVLRVLSIYFKECDHGAVDDDFYSLPLVERMLSLDEGEIEILFCDLGALVSIVEDHTQRKWLVILHASLQDFLQDQTRSQEYFVDIAFQLRNVAENMLRYYKLAHEWSGSNINVLHQFRAFAKISENSQELRHYASCFPVLELIQTASMVGYFGSILFRFLEPFICLVKHMAQIDSQWLSIQRALRNALDIFFLSQASGFHEESDAAMTAMVLLCHAGTHPLVPEITTSTSSYGIYPDSFYLWDETKTGLLLYKPTAPKDGGMYEYRQLFSEFIHDSARSGMYALDGKAYAKAAVCCIQQIYHLSNLTIKDGLTADKGSLPSEDFLSSILSLVNGKWTWSIQPSLASNRNNANLIFLSLGYVAYLLPFSWRYDALIQQCQQESFTRGLAGLSFPARTRQACQQMEAYLQRMGCNVGL